MSNINITNWKYYTIGELFKLSKGKRLTKEDMISGKLNYLGAISNNNAVREHIDETPQHIGPCITVNYNGSVGEAFFQSEPFWATDDINILELKGDQELTENIAMFICTIIKKNRYKYGYGRKWTLEKMQESKLLLPSKNDIPDWEYMDHFIECLNIKHIKTRNIRKEEKINFSAWNNFKISDLFETKLSKGDIQANDIAAGSIPLVSSGESNNGIVAYVDEEGDGKAQKFDKNIITVDMFCNAFYQNQNFYSVSHGRVNILEPRFNMNKYIALFICTIINHEKYRFSYGRAIYNNVINDLIIKLPVRDNNPDWQYMENYIKALPYADKM